MVHFYTFAGRINDDRSVIDCNDAGATYVEAQVAIDMSVVLEEPEFGLLRQLLPADAVLAIQVNYFACGGMAICVSVNHAAADTLTVATFIKSWATVVCGENPTDMNIPSTPHFTSLFPPQDLSGIWKAIEENKKLILPEDDDLNVVTKRFLFDGSKISVLRDEIIGKDNRRPTRVEAVSALIWNAMLASINAENNIEECYVVTSVNLRHRMNPPLPQQSIGNVIQFTVTELLSGKTKNLSNLAEKNT